MQVVSHSTRYCKRVRALILAVLIIISSASAGSAAGASTTLTILVYTCDRAETAAPLIDIGLRPRVRLRTGIRSHDLWIYHTILPSGYYTITERTSKCAATSEVALLPRDSRTIGLVEQSGSAGKRPQSGAIAGTLPVPGVRVYVSPQSAPATAGRWVSSDGLRFYAEDLTPGSYRIFIHFGNCCGFTQDVNVSGDSLTIVHPDLSRFYAQAFAQTLSESSLYGLAVANDGTPWFVEGLGIETRVGHLTSGGSLKEYRLVEHPSVHALTPRPDGTVWFIVNGASLEHLTSSGSIVTVVTAPERSGLFQLVFPNDQSAWMATFNDSLVSRVNLQTRTTHSYQLPFVNSGEENARLTSTDDGDVWYTSLAGNRIMKFAIDGTMTQLDLPWRCGPNRVIGLDGARLFACWDGAYGAGIIDASGPQPRPLKIPATNDGTVAIPAKLDNRVWFIARSHNAFIGVDRNGQQTTLMLKPPLQAYDLVAANHRLWYLDSSAHEIVSVGLDGSVTAVPYPRIPPDASGLPPIDELVPDSSGNVWFIVRRDLALYRIGLDSRLERFAVKPRPVAGLR